MLNEQLKTISNPPFKYFTEYTLYYELTKDLFQSTLIAITNYIITENNKQIMNKILSNKQSQGVICFKELNDILDKQKDIQTIDYKEWSQKYTSEFNNILCSFLKVPSTEQMTKELQQKIVSEFGVSIQVITDNPFKQQYNIEASILIIYYNDKYYQLFKGKCSSCLSLSRKLIPNQQCIHKYCLICLTTQLFGLCSISPCLDENCQKILSINDYFNCHLYYCQTCKQYDQDTCVKLNCSHYVCFEQLTNKAIKACPECLASIDIQDVIQNNESKNCSYCDQQSYNCVQLFYCSHISCPDCQKHQLEDECFLCGDMKEIPSRSRKIKIQRVSQKINEKSVYCCICKQRNYYQKEMEYSECTSCGCLICLVHGDDAYKCCKPICRICGFELAKIVFNHKDYLQCDQCQKMICLYCRKKVQIKQLHICDLQPIKLTYQPNTDKLKQKFQCCSCLLYGDEYLLGEIDEKKQIPKCIICQFHQELSEYHVQFSKQKKKFKLKSFTPPSILRQQEEQLFMEYQRSYGNQLMDYEGVD